MESQEVSTKIKIDFNNLSPNLNSEFKKDISIFTELLHSQFHTILKHPLCQAYLYLKWNQIKYLHFFFVIVSHIIYSSVYTIYALLIYGTICQPNTDNEKYQYDFDQSIPCDIRSHPYETPLAQISWFLLVIFTLLYFINEMIKVLTTTKRYFSQWDSYIDIALIISFPLISIHSNPFSNDIAIARWQFHAAAVGCFLTWLQMMFFIGKLPRFGKYVQMFR